jgi:hypothetical protein
VIDAAELADTSATGLGFRAAGALAATQTSNVFDDAFGGLTSLGELG